MYLTCLRIIVLCTHPITFCVAHEQHCANVSRRVSHAYSFGIYVAQVESLTKSLIATRQDLDAEKAARVEDAARTAAKLQQAEEETTRVVAEQSIAAAETSRVAAAAQRTHTTAVRDLQDRITDLETERTSRLAGCIQKCIYSCHL